MFNHIKKMTYPQSTAGQNLVSLSEIRNLLRVKSSNLLIRSPSVPASMAQMSVGWKRSEHSGQRIFTRDSVISEKWFDV